MDDKNKRTWLIILYLVMVALLLRYFPKAGYGVVAITLLALLFKLKK